MTLKERRTGIISSRTGAMVAHAFNPSTWEAEAGQPGLQELVPGQTPKLQRNPVSKTKTKQQKTQNKEEGKTQNIF